MYIKMKLGLFTFDSHAHLDHINNPTMAYVSTMKGFRYCMKTSTTSVR